MPLRELAAALLGAYRFNRIYRSSVKGPLPVLPRELSIERLETPPMEMLDPALGGRFAYAGDDAYGYGLFLDGKLAVTCWFWGIQRFNDRALWRLRKGEAMLMDIVTASSNRGQGLAPLMIEHASADMHRLGYDPLYAFIWHSHRSSYRAFEKAGWRQVAWVFEIHPFKWKPMLRFCWRSWRRPTRQPSPYLH